MDVEMDTEMDAGMYTGMNPGMHAGIDIEIYMQYTAATYKLVVIVSFKHGVPELEIGRIVTVFPYQPDPNPVFLVSISNRRISYRSDCR